MGRVAAVPPVLSFTGNDIRAAAPVRGPGQWQEMGAVANWLIGKGSTLICAGPSTLLAEATSYTFRYYVWPHAQCEFRLWTIGLSKYAITETDTVTAIVGLEVPSGTDARVCLLDGSIPNYEPRIFQCVEQVSSPSSTPGELALGVSVSTVTGTVGSGVYVTGVTCTEIPRVELESGAYATLSNLATLSSGSAIYEDGTTRTIGPGGVSRTAGYAETEARRAGLFSSYIEGGITITATSFPGTGNVLLGNIPILNRQLYGATNRSVAVAVRAKMNGATPSGQVKLTDINQASTLTFTFTSTTSAWQTGTLTTDCTDMSRLGTSGGIRSGGRDFIRVEGRKTAGTSINVTGICIGEP